MAQHDDLGSRIRTKLDRESPAIPIDDVVAPGNQRGLGSTPRRRMPILVSVGAAALILVAVAVAVWVNSDDDPGLETTNNGPTDTSSLGGSSPAPSNLPDESAESLELVLADDDIVNDIVVWNGDVAIATSVAGTVEGRLYVFDGRDGTQSARHELPGEAVALAGNDRTLWVATVDEFDVAGTALFALDDAGQVDRVSEVMGAATLHATDTAVWVGTEAGLWSYESGSNDPVAAISPTGGFGYGWMTTHNGQLLRSSRHGGTISEIDPATGEATELIDFAGQQDGPTRIVSFDDEVVAVLDEELVFMTDESGALIETGRLELGYRATLLETGERGILTGSHNQLTLIDDAGEATPIQSSVDPIEAAMFVADDVILACGSSRCISVGVPSTPTGTDAEFHNENRGESAGNEEPETVLAREDFYFEIDIPSGFTESPLNETAKPLCVCPDDDLEAGSGTGTGLNEDLLWTYVRSYLVPSSLQGGFSEVQQFNVIVRNASLDLATALSGDSTIEEVDSSSLDLYRMTNDGPWVEYRWALESGLMASITAVGVDEATLIEVAESFERNGAL